MTDAPLLSDSLDIVALTAEYDRWLADCVPVRRRAVAKKHRAMAADPFSFLRATAYWWHAAFPAGCPQLQAAPMVLAAGDCHLENFGTWRDAEGRLAWGLNDLDEAARLPMTSDLVRLHASALLARGAGGVSLDGDAMADALLAGYRDALGRGGQPFVLSETSGALRDMARDRLHEPERFWAKLAALPEADRVPAGVRRRLRAALPAGAAELRWLERTSGLGSLGRPRWVLLARVAGGLVAREAKAAAPAAADFLRECTGAARRPTRGRLRRRRQRLLRGVVRSPDPFLHVTRRWIVRRLAPDCSRIELASLPTARDERVLLWSMGAEVANLHLATAGASVLEAGLAAVSGGARPGSSDDAAWLAAAGHAMRGATLGAWRAWVGAVERGVVEDGVVREGEPGARG